MDRFHGNKHDLDFVIEWDGTNHSIGNPAAFIEIAWRLDPKDSRNKAQDIQAAITSLSDIYDHDCPFIGVILGGIFTELSLNSLESWNFKILYFDYKAIKTAFSVVGIDAEFDEDTPDHIVEEKVRKYEALKEPQIQMIDI